MKIGINLYSLKKEKSGVEIFAENLLEALFKNKSREEEFLFFGKGTYYWGLKRVWYEQMILPRELQRRKIDLLLNITCSGPLVWKGKQITVIHDLAYLRFPEARNIFGKIYFHLMFKLLSRKSCQIITPSNFSKKEAHQLLSVPSEKIEVIPEAVPQEFIETGVSPRESEEILNKFGIKTPYIFYIGIRRPRKNIKRLIEAFQMAKRKFNLKLVLAGEKEGKKEEGIVETGWVSLKEKKALYQKAEMLVLPSLYEGFGLPVLEAQSLGTPVLTSNTSSLPEVAGDSVLYVNPYKVEEIAKGMEKIALDEKLRENLIQKGYENIKRFSWQKAARQLLNLIHSL